MPDPTPPHQPPRPRRGLRERWRRRLISHAAAALLGCAATLYLIGPCDRAPHGALLDTLPPANAPARAFEWTTQPPPAFPIPPYARHLENVHIVLDPGHGGRAHQKNWKRGPTGLREAQVNLRVALALREFLEAVGARVSMTRERDEYLFEDMSADLRARPALANELNADLFLSIHHNGAAAPEPNYTSIFYHGDPDHSPASLDAARHLLTGLSDALRLEQHLPNPLVSDYAIFPNDGFAVLRQADVPAVLTEASFHSNPAEEQRLRDAVYNRREAYGLFLGLARWAQAGLPRIELLEPADGRLRRGEPLLVRLDDGLARRGGFGADLPQIRVDSLLVRLNGVPVACALDGTNRRLRIPWTSAMSARRVELFVDFENTFGQHVLHPRITLRGP